ncbi:hypothetical protein ACW5WQ_21160 [Aeromonas rivuli]|uniref:hypothetical protein n=1 Tax=Aeromonas rivuli TaxID=648794 RepID=UPI0005A85830|nr:hypothetical protein [Aeromonas rivuli]
MSDLQIFVLVVVFFAYHLVCYQAARKQKRLLSVLIKDVVHDKCATQDDLDRAMGAYRFFDQWWFWVVCAVMVPFAASGRRQDKGTASLAMQRFEEESFKLALYANPLSMMLFNVCSVVWFLMASLWNILWVALALSNTPAYANHDTTSAHRVSTPQYVIGRLSAHHHR